jgi:hypothetical protein
MFLTSFLHALWDKALQGGGSQLEEPNTHLPGSADFCILKLCLILHESEKVFISLKVMVYPAETWAMRLLTDPFPSSAPF